MKNKQPLIQVVLVLASCMSICTMLKVTGTSYIGINCCDLCYQYFRMEKCDFLSEISH